MLRAMSMCDVVLTQCVNTDVSVILQVLTAILVRPGGLIDAAKASGESVPRELKPKSFQATIAARLIRRYQGFHNISIASQGISQPSLRSDDAKFVPTVDSSGSGVLSRQIIGARASVNILIVHITHRFSCAS